ncbi:MAG: hypothetical protein AB7F71_06695, partial [Burkholderiaceae bacterium]
ELRSNRCRDTDNDARCARRPKTALLGAAYIPAASPRLPLPATVVACQKNLVASVVRWLVRFERFDAAGESIQRQAQGVASAGRGILISESCLAAHRIKLRSMM